MHKLIASAFVVAITLCASAPTFAASKMMMPKCTAANPMVMVDTKTKMYHGMTDKKSHKMMVASGDKTMMTCKSKADAMGAKMMMNGKAMM